MKYHFALRAAHWGMALLFAIVYCAVWFSSYGDKPTMYGLHKSLGLLILLFALLRLGIKISTKAPEQGEIDGLNKLASLGHSLLYVLMILVPVTMAVPAMLSRGLDFFGWHIAAVAQKPEIAGAIKAFHVPLAYGLAALIAGHILMALYHHFVKKDGLLRKMA